MPRYGGFNVYIIKVWHVVEAEDGDDALEVILSHKDELDTMNAEFDCVENLQDMPDNYSLCECPVEGERISP